MSRRPEGDPVLLSKTDRSEKWQFPDGTRMYLHWYPGRPSPVINYLKPKDPTKVVDAAKVHQPYLPYQPQAVLDDDSRIMPETIPDDLAALHRLGCTCKPCKRAAVTIRKQDRISRSAAARRGTRQSRIAALESARAKTSSSD